MNRIISCFSALCVAAILGLCTFAYVGHKDSLKHVDMAVLVGHGEYGSFLTEVQQSQLDEVLTRYHQGYFFELYIAAPESLKSYAKVPFAVAEYLNAGGIGQNQLRIDDKSQSLISLAQNVRSVLLESKNADVLVFANSLTMPRVKLAFSHANLNSTGFAHTSKLAVGDIPTLLGEAGKFSKSFFGFGNQTATIQVASSEAAVQNQETETDILFKPLELLSSADTQVAWQRVVVNTQ